MDWRPLSELAKDSATGNGCYKVLRRAARTTVPARFAHVNQVT